MVQKEKKGTEIQKERKKERNSDREREGVFSRLYFV